MTTTVNQQLNAPMVLVPQTVATINGTVLVITEGQKATYSCCVTGVTPSAAPTDVLVLAGSGSKTLRVIRIEVSATATLATGMDLVLVKRTTANSGGASTNPAITTHDSTDPTASGSVSLYSANPVSLGAGSSIRNAKLAITALGTATPTTLFEFTQLNDKAIVLRGTSQFLSVNLNGGSLAAGSSFDISVEWTEE